MSEASDAKRRLRRNLLLLLVPAIISATAVFLLWQTQSEIDYWIGLFEQIRAFMEANPWALIALLATLPGLGFPISPILILFAVVLTPRYGTASTLGLAIAAQSVCTVWTYALAAGPLRGILTAYVLKKRALPEFSERNAIRLGLILRLAPGIPYAFQNIVLGILGMRLRHYLLVSIPTTSMWTVGFVLTGGALFEGNAGVAIAGGLILVACILATRMLRSQKSANV